MSYPLNPQQHIENLQFYVSENRLQDVINGLLEITPEGSELYNQIRNCNTKHIQIWQNKQLGLGDFNTDYSNLKLELKQIIKVLRDYYQPEPEVQTIYVEKEVPRDKGNPMMAFLFIGIVLIGGFFAYNHLYGNEKNQSESSIIPLPELPEEFTSKAISVEHGNYGVVVAAFSKLEDAKSERVKYEVADILYCKEKRKHRVVYAGFQEKADADNYLRKVIRKRKSDAYVIQYNAVRGEYAQGYYHCSCTP